MNETKNQWAAQEQMVETIHEMEGEDAEIEAAEGRDEELADGVGGKGLLGGPQSISNCNVSVCKMEPFDEDVE